LRNRERSSQTLLQVILFSFTLSHLNHSQHARTKPMAREVIITDDLDGSRDAQPVRFGFHDKQYEIDLPGKNEAQLAQLLTRYIDKGREVAQPTAVTGRRRGQAKRPGRQDLADIRDWAKHKGLEVSDRGRIRADIIDQYDREQAAPPVRDTVRPGRPVAGEETSPASGSNSLPNTP
jgi:hypothetical protein